MLDGLLHSVIVWCAYFWPVSQDTSPDKFYLNGLLYMLQILT